MAARLGIMASPRAKARLCTYIGQRVFQKYVDDAYAVPPPVRLWTPQQARAKGVSQPTGWYDFERVEIGLVVDESKSLREELSRLDATDVHEFGHHLFNVWPEGEDSVGQFLDNVMTDASNEQRFILEFPWARNILRKGRLQLLKRYLENPELYQGDQEPLYNAAWLTLGAHTVLSVEKRAKGKLTALERLYRGKANAADVWPAVRTNLTPQDAKKRQFWMDSFETIEDKWLEAFQFMIDGWILRLPEPQAEARRKFRALFPEPKRPPFPSLWSFGGDHVGDGRPGQPLAPASKPGGQPKPAGKSPKEDGDEADGKGGDGDKADQDGGAEEPEITIDIPEEIGDGGDEDDDARNDSLPAEDNQEAITEEVDALNRAAEPYCPLSPPVDQWGHGERVEPVDPQSLVAQAQGAAGELAAQLQLTVEPDIVEHGERGRVDTHVIATEPDAEDPFLAMTGENVSSTLDSYLMMMLDTSDSMNDGGGHKWRAARLAGMVFHLGCQLARIPHTLVTSRTLRLLAGDGFRVSPSTQLHPKWARNDTDLWLPCAVEEARAPGLIANLEKAVDSGDNYDVTIPIVMRALALRQEAAKALLIVTDGGVYEEQMMANLETAREGGIITIGVGLDLGSGEEAGMIKIFGEDRVVLARSGNFVGPLAQTVVAAVELSLTYAQHRLNTL
jgi:hypothetical protein